MHHKFVIEVKHIKLLFPILLVTPIWQNIAIPETDKFETWVIEKMTEISSKKVNLVGNVYFGDLDFNTDKIRPKNIKYFDGYFTDSTHYQRLTNIKATKKQITRVGANNSLILLVNCLKSDDSNIILIGKPSPLIKLEYIRDFDGDGFLDVLTEAKVNKVKYETEYWIEIYSFKKNAIIYQYLAKDKWSKADNSRKLLFQKNDVVNEMVTFKIFNDNQIEFNITKQICKGGESVSEIRKNIEKVKETKLVSLKVGVIK